jgi:transposase-like protein
VLPVHEMRLHIHPRKGSGDGLCGSHYRARAKEPITVTPAQIICQRRLAVLEHARRIGNVSETCRTFGISRTRYYEWKNRVVNAHSAECQSPVPGRRFGSGSSTTVGRGF